MADPTVMRYGSASAGSDVDDREDLENGREMENLRIEDPFPSKLAT